MPPLSAGPAQLRHPAADRLGHPAHGIGVLLALPLQLPVLEPLVERPGVHELLVALAHHGVEVVRRVLLPELAQQLLEAIGSGHLPHGPHHGRRRRWLFGFGLFRGGYRGGNRSMQRVRAMGGVLGLFLLPGGLPLPRFFGSCAATGSAAGGASSSAAAGSAATSAVGCSGCASASGAITFFLQAFSNL